MESYKEQWSYFVKVGVWSQQVVKLDPKNWIRNFSEEEKPIALRLLDGFTFFSERMVHQLLWSNFEQLSKIVIKNKFDLSRAKEEWKEFIDSVYIVRVTGENPNDSDSGYLFARYARDIVGLREEQIIDPSYVSYILHNVEGANIILVDDFSGSGNQFVESWNRSYRDQPSLKEIAESCSDEHKFFFCPVICTEKSKKRIEEDCPQVTIVTAHYFGDIHSPLNSNSFIWRDDMKSEGPEFIKSASDRAGIYDLNGSVGCQTGFHRLGLALSFAHSWPDATLPLFYFNENGWKPLLKKGNL